jgi:imidazoleglycerol phosphate synthase glutamine amidotransferase subunit HisH
MGFRYTESGVRPMGRATAGVRGMRLRNDDDAVVGAWCEYGRRFAAAIEVGPLWAVQFHPEKSGAVGLRLMQNFVDASNAA